MWMFPFGEGKYSSPAPPLINTKPGVAIPYLVLIVFATVVGFFGNVLIVGAFIVSKRVRIVGNEYALNLAIADLLVAVFADPFLIIGVTLGEAWFSARQALCEFVAFVCLASCICAFLTLTAVTINRYIYVCHGRLHEKLFNRTRIVCMCIACWILATVLELLNFDFIGWGDHTFDRKHNSCMWDRTASLSYTLFLLIFLIGLPIMIMVTAYILIFIKVKQVKHKVADTNQSTATDTTRNDRRAVHRGSITSPPQETSGKKWLEVVKSTRTFFLILLAFIITWGPYAIVNAVDVYDSFPLEVHLYVSALAHMHAAANCIIYGATNPHFRSAYRRVLCMETMTDTNGLAGPAGDLARSPTMFATQGNFELDVHPVEGRQGKMTTGDHPSSMPSSPVEHLEANPNQNRYVIS